MLLLYMSSYLLPEDVKSWITKFLIVLLPPRAQPWLCCPSSAELEAPGLACSPFQALERVISRVLINMCRWNHLPFPLLHTCTSCRNSRLDPKVCYFKPSHPVMHCSPARMYSAAAVSARKESCILGSSPSAESGMLSSSCAVGKDYKVKNEAWLIGIS